MVVSMSAKAAGTMEVVPSENGADHCIMEKISSAAAGITAPRRVEGTEFAAIKQTCIAETHERPEFWQNKTGIIVAPLRRIPLKPTP